MRPVLFSIGSLNINTYGLMLGLGIIFGLLIMWFLCKRFKVPDKTYNFYLTIMLISTAIGLFGAWAFQQIYRAVEASVNNTQFEIGTDLTFMGGLVFGVVFFVVFTVIFASQSVKKDFWKVSSYCAPGVIMALAIGRMGCFFAGCCWGRPTSSFLGVAFPYGSAGAAVRRYGPVLPTNLFEAIFSFSLAIIMILMIVRFNKEKYTLLVLGGGYSIWRFAIEFARYDDRGQVFALSPSQIQSIVLLAVTIALMVLMIVFRKEPFANRVPIAAGAGAEVSEISVETSIETAEEKSDGDFYTPTEDAVPTQTAAQRAEIQFETNIKTANKISFGLAGLFGIISLITLLIPDNRSASVAAAFFFVFMMIAAITALMTLPVPFKIVAPEKTLDGISLWKKWTSGKDAEASQEIEEENVGAGTYRPSNESGESDENDEDPTSST